MSNTIYSNPFKSEPTANVAVTEIRTHGASYSFEVWVKAGTDWTQLDRDFNDAGFKPTWTVTRDAAWTRVTSRAKARIRRYFGALMQSSGDYNVAVVD